MGVGAVVGALFGMGVGGALAAAGIYTIMSISVGSLWLVGMAIGSLYDMPSLSTPTPTYSLEPISNPMSQLIPVPVVYGKVRVGGNIFYQQFEDSNRDTVYQHVAFSEGPIIPGGISSGDVLANDQDTANLSSLSVQVFEGTPHQALSTWDPDGLSYPYLAYVSLRMEASSKLQGTPRITIVGKGRDIDYPGKGASTSYIAADTEASSGTYSNEYLMLDGAGYKSGAPTVDGLLHYYWEGWVKQGDQQVWTVRDYQYHTMGVLSGTYQDVSRSNIICMPFTFTAFDGASHTVTVSVYPDSGGATHYDFDIQTSVGGQTSDDFTTLDTSGVALHWELRRAFAVSGWIGIKYYYSGVLYFNIPPELLPSSGRAKLYFTYKTPYLNVNHPICGLLPYSDILTDSPWTGFDDTGAYNNPAWCVYDLLTNDRYGCGIPASWMDMDSFIDVASRCTDEGITLNYVVDTQRPIVDHLKEMLSVCRGFLNFRDRISIGMDCPVEAYSKLITSEDFVEGSFRYWEVPLDQRPNRIILEFIDGVDDGGGTWETIQKSIEDWDDIQKRGAFERRVSCKGITGAAQAKAMANYLWESARRCVTYCSFATGLHNSDIEVGDVVAITYDLPGWTEKWMRVVSVQDKHDGLISITCLEYDEAVYDTSDDV
jgi:hypothetical protein